MAFVDRADVKVPLVVGPTLTLVALVESIVQARAAPVGFVLIFGLLGVAATVPIAVMWTQPAATAVLIAGTNLLSVLGFQMVTGAGAVAQLIAVYRLGRLGSSRLAVLSTVPFPVLALATRSDGALGVLVLLLACLTPATALAGIARRAQHEARENRVARERVTDTLLEHSARSERARIARELHDVVAHHISMVAVQAETARLAVAGMPPAGAQRLSDIADTARAALTEMRRLLGVLREDTEIESPDRRPQPGLRLNELNELLDTARDAAGVGVRLILRGQPVILDPGVELAAYRIVQEALTNARRHAPGAAVDVELHYADDVLRLRVRDTGPGPQSGAHGHGLAGMRERATAVGGELRTGPAAGGGFLVEATLPGASE